MPQIQVRLKKKKAVVKIRLNKNEYIDSNRLQFPVYSPSFISPQKVKHTHLVYELENVLSLKEYIAHAAGNKFEILRNMIQTLYPCCSMEQYWQIILTDPSYIFVNENGQFCFLCVPVSSFEMHFNLQKMILDICKEDFVLNTSGLMENLYKNDCRTADAILESILSTSGAKTRDSADYSGTTLLNSQDNIGTTLLTNRNKNETTLLNEQETNESIHVEEIKFPDAEAVPLAGTTLLTCDKEQLLAPFAYTDQSASGPQEENSFSAEEVSRFRSGMTTLLNDNPSKIKKPQFVLERRADGERYRICESGFKIGAKAEYVDLCIQNNKAVSSYHALFVIRNNRCFVRDNMSTNGTFVNGTEMQPFEEYPIKSGDEISIADEIFLLI